MFSSGFKRTLIVLAAVAVFCLGVAHYVPNFADSLVAGEVHEALAPVQKQVMLAWSSRVTLLNYIAGMRRLQAEKSQLEQQISNLTLENNHLQEYVGENQQLEKLLNFKQRNAQRFTLLGARVISRSPDNWYSTLVVDRGSQDGVKKDMVVVSDAGLVGRVDAVWPHTADVILILDPECCRGSDGQREQHPGGHRRQQGGTRSAPDDRPALRRQARTRPDCNDFRPGGYFPR